MNDLLLLYLSGTCMAFLGIMYCAVVHCWRDSTTGVDFASSIVIATFYVGVLAWFWPLGVLFAAVAHLYSLVTGRPLLRQKEP